MQTLVLVLCFAKTRLSQTSKALTVFLFFFKFLSKRFRKVKLQSHVYMGMNLFIIHFEQILVLV